MTTRIAYIDSKIGNLRQKFSAMKLRRAIVKYYEKNPALLVEDPELAQAVDYIKFKELSVFPSLHEYSPDMGLEVYKDTINGFKYVLHEQKRLYFPLTWDDSGIRWWYYDLLREQSSESPHRYLTPFFDVTPDTVLFDIGCAEGLLSLSVVDRVASIHLFEMSEQWIEPLRLTFEPWKDKVRIVRKYVSDKNSEQSLTIDSYIESEGLETSKIMLKLDVEGAEKAVLNGAAKALARNNSEISAVICTYHQNGDLEELSHIMRNAGYSVTPSKGYMLFVYDPAGLSAPFFRRGLIYCKR